MIDKKECVGDKCQCAYCGKEFSYNPSTPNKKYCCEECCKLAQKNRYIRKESWTEERQCACCGRSFVWTSSVANKKYCSDECARQMIYRKMHEKNHFSGTATEERQCAHCGNLFTWTPSRPNRIYCSAECAINASRKNVVSNTIYSEQRLCACCGKKFQWFSNKPGQKYCSKECLHIATAANAKKRTNKAHEIDVLKNEVYLKVSEIIHKMDQARGNSFSGKYIDYRKVGDISEQTREVVLKRDNYECKICKRKDSLHLHHLVKRQFGGTHEPDNLVTLCASCHRHIEVGDVEHATNKCYRNVKKYYRLEDDTPQTIDMYDLKTRLDILFHKLKETDVGDDSEIMIQLDEVIDLLDV